MSSDARLELLFGTVCSLVTCPFESDLTQLIPTCWVRKGVSSTSDSHSALHLRTSFLGTSNPNVSFQGPVQHQTEGSVSTSSMVTLHPALWFPSFSSLQLEMGLLLWLLFCFIVFDAMTHVKCIVSQEPSVLGRQ